MSGNVEGLEAEWNWFVMTPSTLYLSLADADEGRWNLPGGLPTKGGLGDG